MATGAAVLISAMSAHSRAAQDGWELGTTQPYLLATGPYRFTRNPMYLGEAAIWSGWAILFGSLPVAGALPLLVAGQNGAIRLEERMLRERWGVAYGDYCSRVSRWFGVKAV